MVLTLQGYVDVQYTVTKLRLATRRAPLLSAALASTTFDRKMLYHKNHTTKGWIHVLCMEPHSPQNPAR